jgi:hypothetical protein
MATATLPPSTTVPTAGRKDYSAALLSYLVPGLGQMAQGRFGKGVLFFVGVLGLFFYGQYLGQWSNVYLGDTATPAQLNQWKAPRLLVNLYNRPQFAGQFWVGMAAWPAIYHYWRDAPPESSDHQDFVRNLPNAGWLQRAQVALPEDDLNRLQREGDRRWDLGWVYTVIAGVLNVLVIYDALAGPAFAGLAVEPKKAAA